MSFGASTLWIHGRLLFEILRLKTRITPTPLKECQVPSFKFILISVSSAALLGLSACATPATQTASAPAAEAKASMTPTTTKTETASAGNATKQVCKREAVVGSKFKKKICATQDVWDARATADRAKAESIQRGGGSVGSSN
jgi:hypothetical protein